MVMPALIPGEQRQAVLLDGEPLEDVDKFKYLGSMFVAIGQAPRRSAAGAPDFDLRLRDMACMSSRRKGVGGL